MSACVCSFFTVCVQLPLPLFARSWGLNSFPHGAPFNDCDLGSSFIAVFLSSTQCITLMGLTLPVCCDDCYFYIFNRRKLLFPSGSCPFLWHHNSSFNSCDDFRCLIVMNHASRLTESVIEVDARCSPYIVELS